MMYCNFCIEYKENLVKNIQYVKDAKVIENDNNVIVAIISEPLYLGSDINNLINNIKLSVELTTDKKVYVTRNMEIFCDIENYKNNENSALSFDEILNKL